MNITKTEAISLLGQTLSYAWQLVSMLTYMELTCIIVVCIYKFNVSFLPQ